MKNIKQREDIPRMYIEEKLSTVQIGKIVGLTPGAVASVLKARNVITRSTKEGFQTRFPNGRFGSSAGHWKGGKRHHPAGYVSIHKPDHPNATKEGYVMEHRLVMEARLKRILKRSEDVHHINGNKSDNRPENLMVATRKEHSRAHFDAVKDVEKLLAIIQNCKRCSRKLNI